MEAEAKHDLEVAFNEKEWRFGSFWAIGVSVGVDLSVFEHGGDPNCDFKMMIKLGFLGYPNLQTNHLFSDISSFRNMVERNSWSKLHETWEDDGIPDTYWMMWEVIR